MKPIVGPAYPDGCPPFYRFVDFGKYDSDNNLRRGGTVFRSFIENGDTLLLTEETVCVPVSNLSKDGRQLVIPIVSHIEIDTAVARLPLTTLVLDAAEQIVGVAENNAKQHRDALALASSVITRGEIYLCVEAPESETISCQIVPPYGSAVLVIYCNADRCEMPVLELADRVIVRATWPRLQNDIQGIALDALLRLQELDRFFAIHL